MAKGTSVAIVIFDESKKQVLLIKRRDVPVWVLPGGGIDDRESPEEAALREAEEEIGCKVKLIRKVAEYSPTNRLAKYTYFFEAVLLEIPHPKGEETLDAAFFDLKDLPLMPPPYPYWIEDAKKNLPEVIKKTVEGVNYKTFLKLLLKHPLLVLRFVLSRMGLHINQRN